MKRFAFVLFVLLGYQLSAAAAEESLSRLLRFPTVSNSQIVFSYAGDLYTVSIDGGAARKLTNNPGYETFPKFSPDGTEIAFTAQYDGNTEVFIIPADGGLPRRLTYTAQVDRDNIGDRMGPNNIVTGWTPDGKNVIYRGKWETFSGLKAQLYKVSAEGGPSEKLPLAEAGFNSWSPDGKKLAFNRMFREFRTWKYYRGGQADDIWITNLKDNKLEKITDTPAQDIFPMWIGEEIFFASDRDRTMNLFVYNTRTKETKKVTDFTEYDVKFPSCNNGKIVFENAGYIYLMDAATKKYQRVPITLNNDAPYARGRWIDASTKPTAYDISPKGDRVLITARGEVFNLPAEEGLTINLSQTSGANERSAAWSPDGKHIAYISDRSGESEVWMQNPDGSSLTQLTDKNDTYIHNLSWAPDSKSVLYTDRKGRLQRVYIADRSRRTIVESDYGRMRGFDISADGNWITYTSPAENETSIIWLQNIESGKKIQITDKWYESSQPMFSSDGKYLFFTSVRSQSPTYANNEWNAVFANSTSTIFAVLLSADTPNPFAIGAEVEASHSPRANDSQAKDAKQGKSAQEAKQPQQAKAMKVDEDGIMERIVALPVQGNMLRLVYAGEDKIYYQSRELSCYNLKERKDSPMGNVRIMAITADGKKALVADGGAMGMGTRGAMAPRGGNTKIGVVPFGGRMSVDKAVSTRDMKVLVDYPQEWAQIFNESWRVFRDFFYVENMHGVNWQAMHDKYAALLPYVQHRHDLTYIIGEMIGELNIGHAYVTSGDVYPSVERIPTGLLGARFQRDSKTGNYKVISKFEAPVGSTDLRLPLSVPGSEVNVGEYITAVNGKACKDMQDIYESLVGKADIIVELSVSARADGSAPRKVLVKPIDNESDLVYYNWVMNNLRKVEKATNGQVGYIHIPDMSAKGLNMFNQLYYTQLDKKALIIDDRMNGGGNVSPIILERLNREVYRMSMQRNNKHSSTVPDAAHYGPKICLVDKYSSSDGDLFPYGFRKLGLGKLLGVRTWGGIVGISGSQPFLDGQDLRTPFFTSYSSETGEWIIEGHGVDPDIVVDNNPYDEFNGRDAQLDKAIELMLQEIKNYQTLPDIPQGPDKTK